MSLSRQKPWHSLKRCLMKYLDIIFMIVRYDIIIYHDFVILINTLFKLVNPVCHTVKAARVWLVKRFIAVGNMKDGVKDTIRTCGMFTEEWRRAGIFRRSREAIANMVLIGCLHEITSYRIRVQRITRLTTNPVGSCCLWFLPIYWFSLTEGNRLSRCARVLYRPLCHYRNSVNKCIVTNADNIKNLCIFF